MEKIAFIICYNDSLYLNECIDYLNRQVLPKGLEKEIWPIEGAVSMAAGYQFAMKQTDAKYKVYLHQDVFLTSPDFIGKLLQGFQDASVGMIGVVGSSDLREDAFYAGSWDMRCTEIYNGEAKSAYCDTGVVDQPRFLDSIAIDGMLMATQYDLPWNETDFNGWDFYDIDQSQRFWEAGYRVQVMFTKEPGVLHDEGMRVLSGYEAFRKKFCDLYGDRGYHFGAESQILTQEDDRVKKFLEERDMILAWEISPISEIPDKLSQVKSLTEVIQILREKGFTDTKLNYAMQMLKVYLADLGEMGCSYFWPESSFQDSLELYQKLKFYIWRAEYGRLQDEWQELIQFTAERQISLQGLSEMVKASCKDADKMWSVITGA